MVMKRNYIIYCIAWLVILGLFNVITFVTPSSYNGISKFDVSFWVSYGLITLMFIGQMVLAFIVFNQKRRVVTFYKIPIIRINAIGLAIMVVVGSVTMSIIPIPSWIGIIVNSLVFGFTLVVLCFALLSSSAIEEVDNKVSASTRFISLLNVDAQVLVSSSSSEEIKCEVHKIHELIKYSDPMSCEEVKDVESKIVVIFDSLKIAVNSDDLEKVKVLSKQLSLLIEERNAKIKVFKH